MFAEIGLVFARWLDGGDPPTEPPLLRQAFARYVTSADAELITLANLEIGLHEQTRLQPERDEGSGCSAGPCSASSRGSAAS